MEVSSELVYNTIKVGGPVGSWVVNNPKLATATGVTLVGGYLFYYFTHQEYPAPWLDRRQLSSGLTKKQLLEDELTQEKAEKEDWDVIIIGSGGCGLTTGAGCHKPKCGRALKTFNLAAH